MRIFFGATLPAEVKTKIAEMQEDLARLVKGARLEGPDKLHITLQFVGEYDAGRAESLFSSAADQLSRESFLSPAVDLAGMDYFPDARVMRGIWLECRDDGSLAKMAGALGSVMREAGLEPEARRYRPHITVARLKGKGKESPADLRKFFTGSKLSYERFFPESIALFESILNSGAPGSIYRVLHDFPLQMSR